MSPWMSCLSSWRGSLAELWTTSLISPRVSRALMKRLSTWSLFFCQQVNENIVSRAPSLAASTLLVDRGQPALFGSAVGSQAAEESVACLGFPELSPYSARPCNSSQKALCGEGIATSLQWSLAISAARAMEASRHPW